MDKTVRGNEKPGGSVMKKASPAYVVGFMIAVCAICSAAVSFVQYSARPLIEANARLARNRIIARAFGIATAPHRAAAYDSLLEEYVEETAVSAGNRIWRLFIRKEIPRDVGFIFSGTAFWDMVTGVIVLSEDLGLIRSLEIIEQKETPGLGARIEEPGFRDQFKGYAIDWERPDGKRIVFGETNMRSGNRIDAITGASQTSMALERILNNELEEFRRIYGNYRQTGAIRSEGR